DVRGHTLAGEALAQEGERVALQRQTEGAVVARHMLAERHPRQCHLRLIDPLSGCEQRQRLRREPANLPERLTPVESDRAEGIGAGEALHCADVEIGTIADLLDAAIAPAA